MSMIKSYAAKEAGGELEVYEYDPGELKPQDVEVQVDYCGICHSDLSMIDNEWGFSQYPLVAGHEVIGRVVALGSAAQDKGLQVGQRVGIGWTARSCGHCDACISGNQINCEQGAVPTIMNRGGFAEYFLLFRRIRTKGRHLASHCVQKFYSDMPQPANTNYPNAAGSSDMVHQQWFKDRDTAAQQRPGGLDINI